MARVGRRTAAHHARRATQADLALDANFYMLADGIVEWLDNGNYEAFSAALAALDEEYFVDLGPIDPDAPKDARVAALASRYVAATRARSDLRLIGDLIEERREAALAELITTAAEPLSAPVYWQKLIKRIQAEGIRQPDVHPSSRELAKHLASAIREFNAQTRAKADKTYSDFPVDSWADLPREFAGFQLVDVDANDPMLELKPNVHPLPPSPDIAFYTADRIAPPARQTRQATYKAWSKTIEAWGERTNRKMPHQQPAIWAMLLAHRIKEDSSDVAFFDRQLIVSPWQRGRIAKIQVIEDDVPDHFR